MNKPSENYISLLKTLADIRFACRDNGLRMQEELVNYIRELRLKADMFDEIVKGLDL